MWEVNKNIKIQYSSRVLAAAADPPISIRFSIELKKKKGKKRSFSCPVLFFSFLLLLLLARPFGKEGRRERQKGVVVDVVVVYLKPIDMYNIVVSCFFFWLGFCPFCPFDPTFYSILLSTRISSTKIDSRLTPPWEMAAANFTSHFNISTFENVWARDSVLISSSRTR